jgi:hypothetical protein
MADDNFVRSYRSNDLTRRPGAPAPSRDAPSRDVGSSDPLAELARLIGQSDPFAEGGRSGGPSIDAHPAAEAPQSDWRATAAALARESMRNPPPVSDSHYDEVESAVAAAKSLRAAPGDRFGFHEAEGALQQEAHGDYADNYYDDAPRGDSGLGDRHYAAAPDDTPEGESYFFDGATAPADERFYDDPPRARRSNGLITAAVLIGCGILGTAGAYGYRTYYSGVRTGDAPIITPDKAPIKIVPAQANNDSGKSTQESSAAVNERMVAHQEDPVTLSDPVGSTGPGGPRVVLPAPFTPSPGPGPSVQAGPPTPAGASTEPKKVHTLAIRPDGAVDPTARPVVGSPPPQAAPPVMASRQPPGTKPVPPPARASGGPLSLDPQSPAVTGDASSPNPPAPRGAPAPAPAPKVASTSSPASGGYVVQISSQRSEADAQASFRSLQSKYPRELGDREPIVRRADLGPKGIYYRALVGPFGTAADADQLCSDLKADGGQCIVQKN